MRIPQQLFVWGTRGIALLLGIGAGWLQYRPVDEGVPPSRKSEVPPAATNGSGFGRTWVDINLGNVRGNLSGTRSSMNPSIRLRLARNRDDAAEELGFFEKRALEIEQQSAAYRDEPDFAERLRRNDDDLPVIQAWLHRDPDGAIDHISNRLDLGNDDLSFLLESHFGTAWAWSKIHDDSVPYRLRRSMAAAAARRMAWNGESLATMIGGYDSIGDPSLKKIFAETFALSSPMEDPATAAASLMDAPERLSSLLLDIWMPSAPLLIAMERAGSFPVNFATPHPYTTTQWFDELCRSMVGPEVPAAVAFWRNGRSMRYQLHPDGRSRAEARGFDMEKDATGVVSAALEEPTDLRELYGEGVITRSDLLAELIRRIPGAEKHPVALETNAWKLTCFSSPGDKAGDWASELEERGLLQRPMDELLESYKRDPRTPFRLDRLRGIANRIRDGAMRERLNRLYSDELAYWNAVAPAAADHWKRKIPSSPEEAGGQKEGGE